MKPHTAVICADCFAVLGWADTDAQVHALYTAHELHCEAADE